MNPELDFVIKIIRNGFILSGLYFVSVFATGTLTWELCKPVVVFFLGYIFAESARHYKLSASIIQKNKKAQKSTTFVFNGL